LRRAARADFGGGNADRVERMTHGFKKALAVFREPHATMTALEKRRAQRLFQLHDALAYCRLRGA